MNVMIFGASGMVGQGVLRECLADPTITSVVSIGRSILPIQNSKLKQLQHHDFLNYSDIESQMTGFDACFFCLGVSSAGMNEIEYSRKTFDWTIAAANTLSHLNPEMTFIYISGSSTDTSEKGKVMWARVKGRTENALLHMNFKAAYMFRPAVIQPLHGIESKTPSYRILYRMISPLLPLARSLFPNKVTTTEHLAKAMIKVARDGYAKNILETQDIEQVL